MSTTRETEQLWTLVQPYVEDGGYELVEIQWGREPGGWVLRLFIEGRESGPGGAGPGISHSDCERVSRDVSAALDVADSIPHAYHLEVSSPGLDRPLRREKDFARFSGRSARIRLLEQIEGRKSYSGTLRGAQDGVVEIECDGRVHRIPLGRVAKANLVPDWSQEFHRSAT